MKNNVSDYFNNFVMKVIKNKEHLEVFLKASSMDEDMKAALIDMWEDNHKEEVSKNVKVLEGSVVTEEPTPDSEKAPIQKKARNKIKKSREKLAALSEIAVLADDTKTQE
jgi:hypothetical protein